MERNAATQAQVDAADPRASTWLAANAGSGKTKVLTDRVARLLLDGVNPQHILCLTYTKAAASEMQNRLFVKLGEWAMMPDAKLAENLAELGAEDAPTPERLARARTLFAKAVETPGGLKIQTIHAFCSALLRRFPLEAGVSPAFSEIEDRAGALLRADILDTISDGPQAHVIEGAAQFLSDQNFEKFTAQVATHRAAFAAAPSDDDLAALFDLPPDADADYPLSLAFNGWEEDWVPDAAQRLRGLSTTMDALADQLGAVNWDALGLEILARLVPAFLTKAGTARKQVPTKRAEAALEDLLEPLLELKFRIEAARKAQVSMAALERSLALHRFARVFLPEYEAAKQQRGWLDFDDLIQKARHLLESPGVADWVLYRLDGGIDHILVDEAQDTSPDQWRVIELLAQEFTSGEGARSGIERTIFVVGDKKQSIYSFQGADPREFDRMQAEFAERLGAVGKGLADLSLKFSFRSSPAVLGIVDAVFDGQGAPGFPEQTEHWPFKTDLPGRVDLWPFVEKAEKGAERDWRRPVDLPDDDYHDMVLARRIADWLYGAVGREPIPDGKGGMRPLSPGDVLILVQRRSTLFREIIREIKARGLPMAGADRLKVGAELAVKDLGALLAALATPEDSLSLAAALRSPLFGWTEQALFDLAHKRTQKHLWSALRERGEEFPETMAIFNDMKDRADILRPYDLIERVLTRHDGRRKLLGRLGAEAEDGINALLTQALAYERSEIPSLTGFMSWMQTDDLEIKRQISGGEDMIRVMTVHGAKGLEAPLVILPDTIRTRDSGGGHILHAGGTALWKTSASAMPDLLRESHDAVRERQAEERQRLLYVALTRAEKWLIVAGAGEPDAKLVNWYKDVQTALVECDAEPLEAEGGTGLRLESGDWAGAVAQGDRDDKPPAPDLPGFFRTPPPPAPARREVISPSDLGGAKALPGPDADNAEAAKARGTRIHLLLERLPGIDPAEWPQAAERLLPDIPADTRTAELAEAGAVLNDPDLGFVFAPDTLAEVPITADFGKARLYGVIDRLIVSDTRILAVDFKSNQTVPASAEAVPEGLLRQMGAYAHALAQIYPDRAIETAILWTRTAHLMPLGHDLVMSAAARTQHLDDSPMAT